MPITISKPNRISCIAKRNIRIFLVKRPFLKEKYLKIKYPLKNPVVYRPDELFRQICIETISYCNNDCPFCPASTKFGYKKPTDLMPIDLYLKILNELKALNFNGRFVFFGNNEPLLDKRICDLISTARGLFPRNYFSMCTNGLCINAALALELFNAGMNQVTIDNYDDNLELLPGVKDVLNYVDPSKVDIDIVCSLKNDFKTNRAGETLNPSYHLKKPFKMVCQRPLVEIIVGYDGTVPLCCADALWKEKMGNAKKNSLKDIWFSQKFDRIRRALAVGDRNCSEICKVCDRLPDSSFTY